MGQEKREPDAVWARLEQMLLASLPLKILGGQLLVSEYK